LSRRALIGVLLVPYVCFLLHQQAGSSICPGTLQAWLIRAPLIRAGGQFKYPPVMSWYPSFAGSSKLFPSGA
jgi:hypothetical protein